MSTNSEKPLYLYFCGAITKQNSKEVLEAIQRERERGRNKFHLILASPGGDAMAAMDLQMKLRELPELTTYNRGFVGSAAIYPYLAGKRRLVHPDAQFLFHPVTLTPPKDFDPAPNDIEAVMEEIRRDMDEIQVAFANFMLEDALIEQTRMTREQIDKLANGTGEAWLSADNSIECGLAQERDSIALPEDADLIEFLNPWMPEDQTSNSTDTAS